jgi:ABC-type glycerol-3-phosphate transport system permease component
LVNSNQGQREGFSATITRVVIRLTERFSPQPESECDTFQTLWEANEGGRMADLLNLAMLICVSAGSLAFGILAAYGILRTAFALMRPQARPAAMKVQPQVARGL